MKCTTNYTLRYYYIPVQGRVRTGTLVPHAIFLFESLFSLCCFPVSSICDAGYRVHPFFNNNKMECNNNG